MYLLAFFAWSTPFSPLLPFLHLGKYARRDRIGSIRHWKRKLSRWTDRPHQGLGQGDGMTKATPPAHPTRAMTREGFRNCLSLDPKVGTSHSPCPPLGGFPWPLNQRPPSPLGLLPPASCLSGFASELLDLLSL